MVHPDRFRWTPSVDFPSLVVDCRRDERDRGRTAIGPAQPRRREVGVQHLTRAVDRCQTPAPGHPQRSSCSVSHGPEPTDAVRCRSCLRLWIWAAMSSSCCEPLIDIESVSGHEKEIADRVEQALGRYGHLEVVRDGNVVLARTELGRSERVVIAGHLDTVPIAGNVPSWTTHDSTGREIIWGRGACDMKGGVAVQLSVAAALAAARRYVGLLRQRGGRGVSQRPGPDCPGASRLPEMRIGGSANRRMRALRAVVRARCSCSWSCEEWPHTRAFLDGAQRHSRCGQRAATSRFVPTTADRGRRADLPGRAECVMISGGIAGNVIPDRCVIEVNYRFAPDKSPAEAEAYVRTVLDGYPIRVTDVAAGARPGLDQPAAAEFLRARAVRPAPTRVDRCRAFQRNGHSGGQLRTRRSEEGPRRR